MFRKEVIIEVIYSNRFNDLKFLNIEFSARFPPLIFHKEPRRPGVLFRTLEYIALLASYYKIKHRLHK